jgi:hypothetical protein
MRHPIRSVENVTAPAGPGGGGMKERRAVAAAIVLSGLLGTASPLLADDPRNPGFDVCAPGAKHAAAPEIIKLTYDRARKEIIAAGWRPWITREADGSMRDTVEYGGNAEVFWSRGYKEVGDCASTGLTPCIFYFIDSLGNRLEVISQFEERPQFNGHAVVRFVQVLCPVPR